MTLKRRRAPARAALFLLLTTVVAACAGPARPPTPPAAPPLPDRLAMTAVDFAQLPGWREDDQSQALPALRRSCERFAALSPSQPIGQDGSGGLAADWLAPCGALRRIPANDPAAVRRYFEAWFTPWRVTNNGRADGLFTGYYEAEVRGSRRPGGLYRVPLYTRPAGLPLDPAQKGQSYFTRAEIEGGALQGKVPELLWLDDPVDAHILQIQGSGRVTLDDGSMLRVGFNGSNGLGFVGLGKILLAHGKLAPGDTCMHSVRTWLKTHPAEAPALMAENPRYVFFRLVAGDGPVGALGVVLTPRRSLAVDPKFIPLGVPLWLDSAEADGTPLRRLMLAQDIGAGIKGPVRGDVFWGAGEAAFDKAGCMKSRGSYYLLLPRQRSAPVAGPGVLGEPAAAAA